MIHKERGREGHGLVLSSPLQVTEGVPLRLKPGFT